MAHDVMGILRAGESVSDGGRRRQSGDYADGGSSATHVDLYFLQRFRPTIQVCYF